MHKHKISAVILAGGRARRMGGEDKGLIHYQQKPLIEHVLARLRPQVDTLAINANRNLERYKKYGYAVFSDQLSDFQGPLAGISSALHNTRSPYLLIAPCDSPHLPLDLAERLYKTLQQEHADISIAFDGQRQQPLFMLLKQNRQVSLDAYLQQDGLAVHRWLETEKVAVSDFSDQTKAFRNLNTTDDLRQTQNP
ncbi:MAG: molybdenum cofactor guanylyltransferase MobA [Gammaproteobacteria bacterium]|nr:molybdenum cofactor guanylyltransferase MobA [Gammaproteobacteria bacterium]